MQEKIPARGTPCSALSGPKSQTALVHLTKSLRIAQTTENPIARFSGMGKLFKLETDKTLRVGICSC